MIRLYCRISSRARGVVLEEPGQILGTLLQVFRAGKADVVAPVPGNEGAQRHVANLLLTRAVAPPALLPRVEQGTHTLDGAVVRLILDAAPLGEREPEHQSGVAIVARGMQEDGRDRIDEHVALHVQAVQHFNSSCQYSVRAPLSLMWLGVTGLSAALNRIFAVGRGGLHA